MVPFESLTHLCTDERTLSVIQRHFNLAGSLTRKKKSQFFDVILGYRRHI